MKICFVADSYPGLFRFGGIAAYTRLAARALAARGHEIHVLIARREPAFDSADGAVKLHVRTVRWLPFIGKRLPGLGESIAVAWELSRLQRQFKFDAVEFPNWEGIGLVGTLFPATRTVVRLHTSMAESMDAGGSAPSAGDRFMMWAERVAAQRASRVITHSYSHRDRLRETHGLHEIAVVPHGIALPPAKLDGATDASPAMVLTVGVLTARKGASTLLKTIPLLLEQAPDAELVFVGEREDHLLAQRFRAENPGANRVRFLGSVDDQTLDDLYSRCAVYFSPSNYESFGLTFVEAMAHGKPVVGCAAGAIPELIEHEVNGLLVPPNDPVALAGAIGRLLANNSERRRMGAAGERIAREKYSMERMGEDLERFFKNLP